MTKSPIIIIGAGRSGSTLVASILSAHPQFYMIGETGFLLQRLWKTFFEHPEFVNNWRLGQLAKSHDEDWREKIWMDYWNSKLGRSLEKINENYPTLQIAENKRLAISLGKFFMDALIPPELRKSAWGFKEIWLGSSSFNYDWTLYDMAFPDARYVHIVRHPYDFARSQILRTGGVESEQNFREAIDEWPNIVDMATKRKETGRYYCILYEDLLNNPIDTVTALLCEIGLTPTQQCYEALSVPCQNRVLGREKTAPLVLASQALSPRTMTLMHSFGYALEQNVARTCSAT